MISIADITGVVLAGGKSKRMGTAKAKLLHNETSFLENILQILNIFQNNCISINQTQDKDVFFNNLATKYNATICVDKYNNIGPMGGLATILSSITTNYAFVCGCDMPFLTKDFLKSVMFDIITDCDTYDAYVLVSENGSEPLCSVYSKSCLSQIDECMSQNKYGLNYMLSKCNVNKIALPYNNNQFISNINTPSQYALAPIVAISGYKNSGKTTLMCNLVKYFRNKGLTVATIKHDGHSFDIDKNTDSNKHFLAGASCSVVYDDEKMQLTQHANNIYNIIGQIGNVDLIFIEGLKNSVFPKVEIKASYKDKSEIDQNTVIATVCQEIDNSSYCRNDVLGIANCIENFLERNNI